MRGIFVPFLFLLLAPSAGSENRLVIVWEGPADEATLTVSTPEASSPDIDFRLFAGDPIVRLLDTTNAEQASFSRSRGIAPGSHHMSASSEERQVFKAASPTSLYDDALKSRGVVFVRFRKLQADELFRDDAVAEDSSADRDSF